MISRRNFVLSLPVSLAAGAAFGETKPVGIDAVEVWEYRGHRPMVRGVDAQYQINPLFIYDELRPAPYHDNPNPGAAQSVPVSAYYVRIKAEGLVEFYGPNRKRSRDCRG